jgi:hypothetical protein
MDFTILATQLKEIKLTNMSSATKEYIWQTAASLENKRNENLTTCHPPTATSTQQLGGTMSYH